MLTDCPICNGHITISPNDRSTASYTPDTEPVLMQCTGDCDRDITFQHKTTFRLRK